MIFCTRCRRLVPAGDYCPWCRGSWGAAICQDCDHRNTPGVPSCAMCPGINLSEGIMGIRLGWCATLLSALALFGVTKLAITYASMWLPTAGKGGVWLLCTVTGSTPAVLQGFVERFLIAIFLLAPLLGEVLRRLPGQGGYLGYRLRALPLLFVEFVWGKLVRLLLFSGRLLLQLFFGKGKNLRKGTP